MKLKSGIVLLALSAVLWLWGCSEEKKAVKEPPPVEVMVAEVVQKDIPVYQEWVASMDGIINTTMKTTIRGRSSSTLVTSRRIGTTITTARATTAVFLTTRGWTRWSKAGQNLVSMTNHIHDGDA